MKPGLLDVNVLIALAWPSHLHHRAAQAWFARHAARGWATCPLTQCAFVRISSNPRIVAEAVTPKEALALLERITALKHHVFWADDRPVFEAGDGLLLVGHRQVTDAYLLGLARRRGGRLVTLDRGVGALLPAGDGSRDLIEFVPA